MALTNAAAASDVHERDSLAWFQGTSMPAPPTNWYLGLFTTLPADTGTGASPANGTEMTTTANTATGYSGYARVNLGAIASVWGSIGAASGDSTGQQIANANQITFPAVPSGATTAPSYVGFGLYDNATGGTLRAYWAVSSTTIPAGVAVQVNAGNLILQTD